MVMVLGEITTGSKLDYDAIVRGAVKGIGYDSFVDDLGSAESKGLSCKSCEVLVRINKQSPDIAGGVHVGKSDDLGSAESKGLSCKSCEVLVRFAAQALALR